MAGLFDRVVVGLNKGINSVSEGSKIMVEKAQINTQISDAEREKNKLFQNIGVLIYNLQTAGEINVAQCTEICDVISDIDRNIEALRAQLQALETPRAQGYAYAPNGGFQQPVQNGVICSCGFLNKEGAKFCAKCGNNLLV